MLSAPGSYHDAAVFQLSAAKAYFSTLLPRRYLLGDSAYPLSEYVLTPYPDDQARHDNNKALYNARHSGARVEQSEDIYGMLKRRFPIVKHIRLSLENSWKVVNAAAVLHNVCIAWDDEEPDEHPLNRLDQEPQPAQMPLEQQYEVLPAVPPAQERLAAQLARDTYRYA